MKLDRSSDYSFESTYASPSRPIDATPVLSRLRSLLLKLFIRALGLLTALVLPFFVLVGSSVFVYRRYGLATWPALAAGLGLTALLLLLYTAWISKKLTGRIKVSRAVFKGTVLVVAVYCLYALIYLSSLNAKSDQVRAYYRSLNPLLRVAVSTLILADDDVVITDMQRRPADYQQMGLSVQSHSLHYEQVDGYVYALDLRTRGRAEWKNGLTAAYFRVLGFNTRRHVGTEDHLHVSLPTP